MRTGPRNLITDVEGLRVGSSEDHTIKTGTTVLVADGPFRALAFYCTTEDPDVLSLGLDEQAEWIARAVGPAGSCAEYLHNTVSHLEALGIRDRYLWTLQAKVAAEIDRL